MTGESILHYRILQKVGEGGMGVVYKAADIRLNRFVALKFLPARLASSPVFVERLLREAKAISALNHPHIATIYDVQEAGDRRFLVLEYLPGGTLREKIKTLNASAQRLSIAHILEYARQAAEGLAHAHRRNILHRDIKTSNLMLSDEGLVKLTDFGVAKVMESAAPSESGGLVGTVRYMSPEQASGRDVDARSDIFSFGVVIYELVCGRVPFEAASETAILREIVNAAAPPVRQFRADCPAGLEDIIATAMCKKREERYQRMEALIEDLQDLQKRLSDRTLEDTSAMATLPLEPARASRSRRFWIGGSLAVLTAAAFPAFNSRVRERMLATSWFRQLPAEKQLAVLPFHNVGGDAAEDAFCAGLVEILTNKLTQLEQFHGSLRVVDSSEIRKENVTSPREAWSACGATLAISGSVQRLGNSLVITANLVDTRNTLVDRSTTLQLLSQDRADVQELLLQNVAEMLELQLEPQARRTLSAGLTRVPGAYELYIEGRGYLQRYDKQENLDRALSVFQKAVELDPNYALAVAGEAEAYWRKHRISKDPQLLEQARAECLRALKLNDGLAPVHMTMGLIQSSYSQYDQAIASFHKASELDPVSADIYRELANAYSAAGRQKDAEETYQAAIQLRRNYWAAYKDLGVFYFRHDQYEAALPYFQKVMELTPDNYSGMGNLAGVYLKLGRFDEAAAVLEKSIRLRATDKAYSNLGTSYYFAGRYREAAESYKHAAELNPTNNTLWGNLGDAYRWAPGMAALAPDAFRKAIELTNRQIAISPNNALLHAAQAAYWSAIGNRDRAGDEIKAALKLDGSNGTVLFRAAIVYEQAGARERALEALESAIRSGYSMDEIRRAPPLAQLQQDKRFQPLIALDAQQRAANQRARARN